MTDALAVRPFLWGAASSAFQTEGSPHADWSAWDPGARLRPEMTGHWERYREDVALLGELGLNAYRFSVEWSRIEPEPGRWDDAALEHYSRLVDAVRAAGAEPLVTLHHFTSPAWLQRAVPWTDGAAAAHFAAFTARVAEALPQVRLWVTFNEPMVLLLGGYLDGCMPPGARDPAAAWSVLRTLLEAHAAAAGALRARIPGALVGIAHNMAVFAPDRPWHPLDHYLAAIGRRGYNLAILEAFRTGRLRLGLPFARAATAAVPVRGTLDFLGVNYYQRLHTRFSPGSREAHHLQVRHRDASGHGLTDMGWEEHPEGLATVLREAAAYGVPLLVTENGIATREDARKITFIRRHVEVLEACRRRGIDVRGYFYWSLTDTYEWLCGLDRRFGLYRVDWRTLVRRPTAAARYYAQLVRERRAALTDS